MTKGTKIGLILGAVGVVGVGIYFLVRNQSKNEHPPIGPGTYTPPNPNITTNTGAPKIDWSGIVTTVINSLPRNVNTTTDNTGTVVSVTEPTVKTSLNQLLYVDKSKYNSKEITAMQTYLIGLGGQSKMWVETTGGADGKIGNGFKHAYTWAVLSKKVADLNDLYAKSGAQK